MGLEQFLAVGGSVTTILLFWFYLGYKEYWMWTHQHAKVVGLMQERFDQQVKECEHRITELKTSEKYWMANALRSTNIADKVLDRAVS